MILLIAATGVSPPQASPQWKGPCVYSSDLNTILRMLKRTQHHWVVHLQWPETEEAGSGAAWQAELFFVEGKVITCHVSSRVDGHLLLMDQQALRWLASLQHFTWRLEPFTPPQAPAPIFSSTQAPLVQQVPRRIMQAEQGVMNAWSRKQRQIFGLVDGSRTVEQIATILHQPPPVVAEILNDLQAMGVIQK